MAARIRALDWARTPFGPLEGWPAGVRLALETMLAMPGPATLIWGEDGIQLYNDAYIPIARERHPALLGKPVAEGWEEAFDAVLKPVLAAARAGKPTRLDGNRVMLRGPDGALEERIFDSAWSPVRDETGKIAGALEVLTEVTERHRMQAALRDSEERQAFLLKLSDRLRPLGDPAAIEGEACRLLAEELGANHAHYGEIDEAEGVGTIRRDFSRGGLPSLVGRIPLADFGDILSHYKRGGTMVVADVPNSVLLSPADRKATVALHMRSLVTVPLIKDGQVVGALVVAEGEPRAWTDAEVSLVEETAERMWAAIGRARAEAALRDSEERLRGFAEASSDVLWIANAETRRLEYLSPAYEEVWGEPRATIMADLGRWTERLHPEDAVHAGDGFGRLLRGERYQAEYRIVRPDGGVRYIQDTGFPIVQDGRVVRVAGVAQDLTERRLVELALAGNERRLRGLMEALPQLVWRGSGDAQWIWASPQWTAYTGQTDTESRGEGWLDALHPEDREGALKAWAGAATFGGFQIDYRIRDREGVYRWFRTQARPIRDEDGAIREWVGTSTDVDELLRLQRHQRLLLAELQHRVRNTLGVVRSIVRRTAGTSRTVEDMEGHLQGRLSAFSRVQAALTRAAEAGVELAHLVDDELLAHAAREGETIRATGPEVNLPPRVAEALSLAVHELASNAVKHGALSTDTGRLKVSWRTENRDGAEWLHFTWQEFGVRVPANAPAREGFGLELLERSLPYELDARTRAEFLPTGFRFTLSMPLPAAVETHAPAMAAE